MAINQQNIPVTLIDAGLKQDKSSIAIGPQFTPRCQNIVIHDGEVKKRTGLVMSWNKHDGSDGYNTLPNLGFYHYENFLAGVKNFFKVSLIDVDAVEPTTKDISAFADATSAVQVTSAAHGLLSGETVAITGTDNYDGTYHVSVINTNDFEISPATWVSDDAKGTWTKDGSSQIFVMYWDAANSKWNEIASFTAEHGGAFDTDNNDYYVNFCEAVDDDGLDGGGASADGKPTNEELIINITSTDPKNNIKGCDILRIYRDAGAWKGKKIEPASGTQWYKAKRVLFFFGRLVLLGGDDDGRSTNNVHKILWSSQWDHSRLASGTKGAGHFFTYDTAGAILNGEILDNKIVCFKEDSIWEGTNITSDPYIHWTIKDHGIGLLGCQLLAKFGNALYFVGTNGIYSYKSGGQLENIGEPIWTSFLSDLRDGGISDTQLYVHRCFTAVHRDKGDIAFWIVAGTSNWPNKAYVYNVFDRTWTTWSLPGTACVTCAGEYEHDTTVTDAEFIPYYGGMDSDGTGVRVLKYDYATFTDVNDSGRITLFEDAGDSTHVVVTSTAHGLADGDSVVIAETTNYNGTFTVSSKTDNTFEIIDTWVANDATGHWHTVAAIDARWESKDFVTSLADETQWDRLYVDIKGEGTSPTIDIEMSLDSGTTYEGDYTTQALSTTDYDVHMAKFNRQGYKSRYRMKNASVDMGFIARAFEVQPGSDEAEEA